MGEIKICLTDTPARRDNRDKGEQMIQSRLEQIRDKNNTWDYSEKPDSEIIVKSKAISEDFAKHKFRPGEYYDRYLDKLLIKHALTLVEYWAGGELLERGKP